MKTIIFTVQTPILPLFEQMKEDEVIDFDTMQFLPNFLNVDYQDSEIFGLYMEKLITNVQYFARYNIADTESSFHNSHPSTGAASIHLWPKLYFVTGILRNVLEPETMPKMKYLLKIFMIFIKF